MKNISALKVSNLLTVCIFKKCGLKLWIIIHQSKIHVCIGMYSAIISLSSSDKTFIIKNYGKFATFLW